MARTLVVSLDGVESSFGFKSVDRADLYGRRRRVALDREGEFCSRASLLDDGSLLLRSGMTGQGYFLPDGSFVKQSELEAFDTAGEPVERTPSTIGVAQSLQGPVGVEAVLGLRVSTVYALDDEGIDAELLDRLRSGDMFQFAFNYRDDFRAETAVLLANDDGVFALVGLPVAYEWSTLQAAPDLPTVDDDSDDDLDFEMF